VVAKFSIALALLACVESGVPCAADELMAVPRIVDAETVEAGAVKIRLSGVDAPESDQRCLDARGQVWS
jgi:endonuclease YncB( thermonuclease family)